MKATNVIIILNTATSFPNETFQKLDLFSSLGSREGEFPHSWNPWTDLISIPRLNFIGNFLPLLPDDANKSIL
jgi:hypothetical protein